MKFFLMILVLLVTNSVTAQTLNDLVPESWPDSRYTINNDGTVIDQVTGLMWMQCSEGQVWGHDTVCSGDAHEFTWNTALEWSVTREFAGYSDWRLPSIKELSSLTARNRFSPAINLSVFPSTPSESYWTASVHAENIGLSWSIFFGNGGALDRFRNTNALVRLVRAGQ